MNRYFYAILLLCLCHILPLNAQIKDIRKMSVLKKWQDQGWQIQQYTMSYDSSTVIFSGKHLGKADYDLYETHRQGNGWSKEEILPPSVNTDNDEIWPSLTSDGQTLYFSRHYEADKSKKTKEQFIIYTSEWSEKGWQDAQSLIFSSGYDVSPFIAPDNKTLFFASRRPTDNSKDIANSYSIYYTRKVNKYDWFEPEAFISSQEKNINYYGGQVNEFEGYYGFSFIDEDARKKEAHYSIRNYGLPPERTPLPVARIEGTITEEKSGRQTEADIAVYDALTGNKIALYEGKSDYRIALPYGTNYHIDIYGKELSHRYIDIDCRQLAIDTVIREDITLSKDLNISVYVFDSEQNIPIEPDKIEIAGGKVTNKEKGKVVLSLPIGKSYDIRFHKRGYASEVLTIDTDRPVLLTQSELDMELKPSKTRLSVHLTDEETGEQIKGHVVLQDTENDEQMESTGEELILRQGHRYIVKADAVGYLFADSSFYADYDIEKAKMSIPMMSIQKDLIMRLKNIQFEYNSAELMEESYAELDMVVRLMKLNPQLRIELSAHTDNSGSDSYNDRMSQKRGDAAKQYLIRKGIEAERIVAIGYGKRKPITDNDTEEHRTQNRRVEFKVL